MTRGTSREVTQWFRTGRPWPARSRSRFAVSRHRLPFPELVASKLHALARNRQPGRGTAHPYESHQRILRDSQNASSFASIPKSVLRAGLAFNILTFTLPIHTSLKVIHEIQKVSRRERERERKIWWDPDDIYQIQEIIRDSEGPKLMQRSIMRWFQDPET